MSDSIKEYEQVVSNFLNEVSIYNKIEKAEENSNDRINQFEKFILKNQSLLANFTGVEKHICFFTDSYQFEQIFDYSLIENSTSDIQLLANKSNLLLEKAKEIIAENQRHTNDKFIAEIKNFIHSCKEKMTLRDIATKISEADRNLGKVDDALKEIDVIKSLLLETNKKLQVISPYYDRYNKQSEENKTNKLITHYNNIAQISDLPKIASDLSNQNQLLESVITNFSKEIQDLTKVQKSLSSNINIWKEDADYYFSQTTILLPNLSTSDFNLKSILNDIAKKEDEKSQYISDYEISISKFLDDYQGFIDDHKNNQYSKADFEVLIQEIHDAERRKRIARNKKITKYSAIGVAVITVIVFAILKPYWTLSIAIIIAGIILYFKRDEIFY